MGGIYKICINDRCYIGRDSNIHRDARKINHLSYLRRGLHWIKDMQADFDINGEDSFSYEAIDSNPDYTSDKLNELEKMYIDKHDTYRNGYNSTKGGIGMLGYKYSEESCKARAVKVSAEKNPQSKLTNDRFYEIVEMLKKGSTNMEIAIKYGLSDRYVSLIRHKRRYVSLWEGIDYEPTVSNGRVRKLRYEDFVLIVGHIEVGSTNASIERAFGLSGGTGSRIRHRKLYKEYWERYDAEKERSTTSREA
jgi:hypothetical protein